jgi:beta-ribofuranosylaminobenzene 5'-phosphate synthase
LPPLHHGLGTKTSLVLSVLAGVTQLCQPRTPPQELRRLSGRGGTSGIGVNTFFGGGLVVDAGHRVGTKRGYRPSSLSADAGPPPVVGQYSMPEEWTVLLIQPAGTRTFGKRELRLFEEVCPVPMHDVASACHAIMMILIPATIERDISQFAHGLNRLSELRWKSFQLHSQSIGVREMYVSLREVDGLGVCMSSWGPTLVCIGECLEDPVIRGEIRAQAASCLERHGGGSIFETRPSNGGPDIVRF